MNRWLLKTEPKCYSWDDLVKDKKTAWDGVSNALALKHLCTMKKGDLAFVYHTGGERSVIGVAEVVSAPYPDPKEQDDRLVVVDIKPTKKLDRAVSLDEIKADKAFAGWDLLRIGRLSIVPVSDAIWKRIEDLGNAQDDSPPRPRKSRNAARSKS